MAKKYNADVHINVVNNLRELWKKAGKNSELDLTDAQVWDLFEEWYLVMMEGSDMTEQEQVLFSEFGEDSRFIIGMEQAMLDKMDV
jgi:hypothetical protein